MKPIKDEILPQLLLEDSFSATVSEPPSTALNCLSIQFISSLGPLTRLLMDMKQHYATDATPVSLEALRKGAQQYFAVLSADGFWYRSQLREIAKDDDALLFDLFDYGRREIVPLSNVRHLDVSFRGLDKLATPVYLALEQFTEQIPVQVVMREIGQVTRNISLLVKVLENYRGRWIVDIVSNGFSLGHVLADKKLAISCAMAQVRKQIDRELQRQQEAEQEWADVEAEEMPPRETRDLKAIEVGHFDSPERIFVQLKSDLPELHRMQEILQIVAPSLTAVGASRIGQLCIAQNSFDGQWYRARILDSAPDMTSVQFIDYGNTDVITSDKGAKLKRMVDEFAAIPEFAKFCALPMRPKGTREWADEVFSVLGQYMDRPDKECEFLTETKLRRHFVRLFVQGEDLENVLRAHGWGESVQLIRSGSVCYVSHINSLAEFFLHLDADGTVLDLLNSYFQAADKFAAVSEPAVGSVYAALFEEDGQWYRAKVVKRAGEDSWSVMFIDYGNYATVRRLREIESREIRDIAPLSHKCKLHVPKNVLGMSLEAENLFEELAQSGVTVMTVNLVSVEKGLSVVELFVKETGVNVLELLPLSFNPYEQEADCEA